MILFLLALSAVDWSMASRRQLVVHMIIILLLTPTFLLFLTSHKAQCDCIQSNNRLHGNEHTHTFKMQEEIKPAAVTWLALVGSRLPAHSSSYQQVLHLEQACWVQPLVLWIVTRLLQVGPLGAAPTGRTLLAPLGQVQGQLRACPVTELVSLPLQ